MHSFDVDELPTVADPWIVVEVEHDPRQGGIPFEARLTMQGPSGGEHELAAGAMTAGPQLHPFARPYVGPSPPAARRCYPQDMPRRRKSLEAPGELEAAVLDALWEYGELSTPDAFERVGTPRDLAYTTILTVLQRLTKKGLLVRREGGGRSHLYAPALTREQFAERRGETLAAALVGVGAAGLGAFLAEVDRLDPQVVAQLRRQLGARR